jgi:arsenite methyltransferase
VQVVGRRPMGVEDCALYPLFTEDLLELMRTLIPVERRERVATAIVLRARRAGPSPEETGA